MSDKSFREAFLAWCTLPHDQPNTDFDQGFEAAVAEIRVIAATHGDVADGCWIHHGQPGDPSIILVLGDGSGISIYDDALFQPPAEWTPVQRAIWVARFQGIIDAIEESKVARFYGIVEGAQ